MFQRVSSSSSSPPLWPIPSHVNQPESNPPPSLHSSISPPIPHPNPHIDNKWTKFIQLYDKQQSQSQTSSSDEEDRWTEVHLVGENVTTSKGKTLDMDSPTREQDKVMLCEPRAHEKAQICVDWVCTMHCSDM